MGDFNHGNIKWDTLQSTGVEDQKFLCLVQDNFLTQHVLEPTRATRILDIVISSQKELVDNVEIKEPLGSSDHNQMHFNINVKSDKTKVKQCRRDFRKGNYKEIRKRLTLVDWNDKMKNKTAAECWNIVRGELDNAIDSYVPMKKQGKRSKKKHLSKEAFRKIRYKQNIWWVYKHTGKYTDYDAYKEALNAATNEVRKSKRNFEHKLAQNIKSDSKSFYAYVRSKHNVRDKVGPLKDNAGNIITQGFLMAEELNMHFSSVFTRENTSSLPVPETKFNGSEGERLGQLVVTPEVVASKINNMKENKSPGVDGISPKILKEIVEQISMPLAHVFNMSLQKGIVPLESSSSSLGSRCVPWLGEGLSMSSPNYPVLCCPLPYRVAPVFVQVVSPPLGWSPLSSFLVIWSPSGDARVPSVILEVVNMPCPGPFHFSHSVDYIYEFCPLPDPDVGPSIFVCDVEHTSFHFGLCGRKFVLC